MRFEERMDQQMVEQHSWDKRHLSNLHNCLYKDILNRNFDLDRHSNYKHPHLKKKSCMLKNKKNNKIVYFNLQ